ncbi:MAG: PIN domain-containing protein [Candidatus Aquilonibacter sp.]
MFTTFPVVLDACVLVPNWLRDVLLTAGQFELYRPRWSSTILGEVRRTLINKIELPEATVDYTLRTMLGAFPEATVTGYESLIDGMLIDKKDRHVLAAAIVGQAQVIVTSNLKHFPIEHLKPLGIEPMSADCFLMDLLARYEEEMFDVLEFMTNNTGKAGKPEMSLRDIVENIGKTAENFAAAAILTYDIS